LTALVNQAKVSSTHITRDPVLAPSMRKFRIRGATINDLDVLVRQRHAMFEEMRHRTASEHRIGDDSFRRWAASRIRSGSLRCYLAILRDGKVVAGGCVWLRPVQPGPGWAGGVEPYLLSMYTEPEFRRMGLATAIVKEAVRWARGEGYQWMNLHASRAGRRIYKKMGWRRSWEMEIDLD